MIKFNQVAYSYNRGEPNALKNLSFELEDGSFHFITGPSGAGKSTLFRMMYMDIMPSTGALTIFGRNTTTLTRDEIAMMRRKIGIVFQDSQLLENLNVRENVSLPLSLHGIPTCEQEKCVDEILDWVGLADKREAYPSSLSGGEQQRVAIARAVVNRPKVLVADEPTGNVEEAIGRRIMHLFTELNKHGTTVLVATHDNNLVKEFNYPSLYLKDGSLLKVADNNNFSREVA